MNLESSISNLDKANYCIRNIKNLKNQKDSYNKPVADKPSKSKSIGKPGKKLVKKHPVINTRDLTF
jgi:hypothetical protein